MEDAYRLGGVGPNGESIKHTHPRTYRSEPTNGGTERLRIGADGLPVVRALLTAMPEPFWILYLHLVPRTEDASGRYQSTEPWTRDALATFLDEYASLLQSDGRYDLWIKSVQGPDLLVYDRHEIVFAYGDLKRFRTILAVEGYRVGEVTIPNPHEHPYRAQNDEAQRRLFAAHDWSYFPLEDSDGP